MRLPISSISSVGDGNTMECRVDGCNDGNDACCSVGWRCVADEYPPAVSFADWCRTATTEGCCNVMNDCWLAVDELDEFDELSELNAAVADELPSPVLTNNI